METKGSEFPPLQNYTAKVREGPKCGLFVDFLFLVLNFYTNSNKMRTWFIKWTNNGEKMDF